MITILRQLVACNIWVATLNAKVTAWPCSKIVSGPKLCYLKLDFTTTFDKLLLCVQYLFGEHYPVPTGCCLETILYKRIQEEDKAFALYVKENWKRYLDDWFIFWERQIEDLIRFEKILNSLHKDIRFKMQVSDTELPFHDILFLKDKHIITDIFYKITDSKQYLNFS